MSSLELSDEICSSEDEDVIIAKMETRSGLPDRSSSLNSASNYMKTESSIATVKMTGMVCQGDNLYDSDSESDGEMDDQDDTFPKDCLETADSFSSKIRKVSDDSRSSSVLTVKSSVTSSDITVNGNTLSDVTSANTQFSRGDSVISINSDNTAGAPSSYKDGRFNPFDRDLHVDEDHFEASNPLVKKTVDHERPKNGKLGKK